MILSKDMEGFVYKGRKSLILFYVLVIFLYKSLGCKDSPVGIADSNIIPDDRFTATSYYDSRYVPKNARLNSAANGWAPKTTTDPNDYLQIDLGHVFVVCAVATQGCTCSERTTQYKISTSIDNSTFRSYKLGKSDKLFAGNTDRNTVVKHALAVPTLVRFIRFIPTAYYYWKVLRVELYGVKKDFLCRSLPVGISDGKIPDSDMTSSSSYNSTTSPSKARLNYTAGSSWCAATSDSSPHLQINLGSPYIICGIATQGDHMTDQWVQSYQMHTSNDGTTFTKYMENSHVKSFTGNFDSSTVVKNPLYDGTVSHYIHVVPTSHYGTTNCIRTELYGIKQDGVCGSLALGSSYPSMIPDHRFTASSYFNMEYKPSYGRLITSDKGWGPKTMAGEWLQIDLGSVVYACAVATQGIETLHSVEWVTKYRIRMSLDNVNWNYYQENNLDKEFRGNTDSQHVVINNLKTPVKTKFLRFYPTADKGWPSMRVEVYGTSTACSSPVGLEKGIVWNIQNMTSSSDLDNNHTASHGRLYGNSSWCSSTSSNTEYIQINLGQVMTVTGIATQGDHTMDKWVETYTISYSMDGNLWNMYKAGGTNDRVFQGNSDNASVVVRWLTYPLTARHVRVTPQTWNTATCMRLELYGCDFPTRPVISGLTNQNLTATANSYVDLVCIVQEPLIQYIKWYTNNIDITSKSTGLVHGGANGLKSTLRVNYTSADDVLDTYHCVRSDIVLCTKAFVCRSMYEEIGKHTHTMPNAGVTGRIGINRGTYSFFNIKSNNADSLRSAGVSVRLDYPSILAAPTLDNIKSTSVNVKWTPPVLGASQTRVTSYVLQYRNSAHIQTIHLLPPAASHVITGLAVYTNYSIKIKAISRVGHGQWSASRNFTTDSEIPISSPRSVTAKALTSTSISITWQAPTFGVQGPILGYNVAFEPATGGATRNITTTQTACIINKLLLWTEYNINVSIYNDKGQGPAAIVRERTSEDAPSQPPGNFNVTVLTSTSVRLSWGLPPVSDRNGIIRGFEVYYKKTGSNEGATHKILPGNSTLQHVLDRLEKYTRYTFKVLAYTIKNGPYSNSIEKTTNQDAPSSPTNLQISIISPNGFRGPQMNVTWDEPDSPNGIIQSYTVSCDSSNDSSILRLNHLQDVIFPVFGGTTYWCGVRARTIKEGNQTTKRVAVQIYAPTTAPQNVKHVELNITTFLVQWQPLTTTNGPVEIYELTIEKQIKQSRLRSSRNGYEMINATCCKAILHRRSPCSLYAMSVRAYSIAGSGPGSKPIKMITSDPGPPRNLVVSNAGKRDVTLRWDKPEALTKPVQEYMISFNGTNLYEKDVEVHRGRNISLKETVLLISDLHPSTHYEFQVSAKTECGIGRKSRTATANTSVDAPPSPLVEYVSNINESISNIPSWKASNINGMIRAYQFIVLEVVNNSRGSYDARKLTDYYKAKEEELLYYIAAQVNVNPGETFPQLFTIGDEKVYKGYKNMELVHGKNYHVLQRAMTQDEKMEYLPGPASLIAKGTIHEHGDLCIGQRPSQTTINRNDTTFLTISLAFNAVSVLFFILFLIYIINLKRRLENAEKRPDNSEITSSAIQAVYGNPNAVSSDSEELPMSFLSQGRNSDYQQIDDLLNSDVLGRPTASASNSLYQSIYFEEESQPKISLHLGSKEESPQKGGSDSANQTPYHYPRKEDNATRQYQSLLQKDSKGAHEKLTAYHSLQKDQQAPEYANPSLKKEPRKRSTEQSNRYPKKNQSRPDYQSLHEDFKQSSGQMVAYQSLEKDRHEYVNRIPKEGRSIMQAASYQALQNDHTKPTYQSLGGKDKKSAMQTLTYQSLNDMTIPEYQTLHLYANTEPNNNKEYINTIP